MGFRPSWQRTTEGRRGLRARETHLVIPLSRSNLCALPKRLKPGVEAEGKLLRLLDQYDCVVDEPVFQDTLNYVVAQLENDSEPPSRLLGYHDLILFLAECVEACHGVRATSGKSVPFNSAFTNEHGPSLPKDKILADESAHRVTLLVAGAKESWKESISQARDIGVTPSYPLSQRESLMWPVGYLRVHLIGPPRYGNYGSMNDLEPCF